MAGDGGVFTFGDAKFFGSAGNLTLASPVVGMSVTSTGKGYYLVGADGGVFTFGDAVFAGMLSDTLRPLEPDGPAIGIAANPVGAGYLIATAQGAIVRLRRRAVLRFAGPQRRHPGGATRQHHLRARRHRLLGRRGRRRDLHLQLDDDRRYGDVQLTGGDRDTPASSVRSRR